MKGRFPVATLHIMSSAGDNTFNWDKVGVEAQDPEAVAAVREAERIFREQRARGAVAFKVTPGQPGERIDDFDPKADRIIMIPRIAGG
jgi:hypothetical protein